nr:hypothetical protein CFP56_75150 [Quercus suber]
MLQDGNQNAKQQWVQQNAYNKKGNLGKVGFKGKTRLVVSVLMEGFHSKSRMFLGFGLWIMVEAMVLHDVKLIIMVIFVFQVKGRLVFLLLLREMFDSMLLATFWSFGKLLYAIETSQESTKHPLHGPQVLQEAPAHF